MIKKEFDKLTLTTKQSFENVGELPFEDNGVLIESQQPTGDYVNATFVNNASYIDNCQFIATVHPAAEHC